jgi:hypothetical protein
MKISSLLAVLRNFESAVAVVAGSGATNGLSAFRQLFVGHDQKNVAPFIDALIGQRDIHGRNPVSLPISNLCEALRKLEACLRSADAKKAADDVAKLVELLEGCGQPSVDDLVRDAREWLTRACQPKSKPKLAPTSRTKKKPAAPVVEALPPTDYAALLKRTAKDNVQFDQVVERLRADRKIKKPDMREIARLFLGYELAKKKGREDALTEITEQQAVEARQDARGSVLDRLKPW